MPFRRRPAGLTLVELLVAVALLGIVASLAAPPLTVYAQRARLRGILDRFVADLYLARAQAARSGERLHIRFEADGAGCVARYGVEEARTQRRLSTVEIGVQEPGVCFSLGGSSPITIDERGLPVGAARSVRVRLAGQADSLRISLVGRVRRWGYVGGWPAAVAAATFSRPAMISRQQLSTGGPARYLP